MAPRLSRRVRIVGAVLLLLLMTPPLLVVGYGIIRGHDIVALFGGLAAGRAAPTPRPGIEARAARVEYLGDIESMALLEASGLAFSRRDPSLLWSHNDSGNPNALHALGLDGRDRGSVPVAGLPRGDWEDIAAFELHGKPYLLIGDVGDNLRWRHDLTLYAVPEPNLEGERADALSPLRPAWSVAFRYPDGLHRDCEAIGVDAQAGLVLLVTKRVIPTEVYTVPLRSEGDRPVVATRIATLELPQPTVRDVAIDPKYGEWGSAPTALALGAHVAVVVTYKDAYVYRRSPGEAWGAAFSRRPERLRLPTLRGREAAALALDERSMIITSERYNGLEAALYRVHLDDAH